MDERCPDEAKAWWRLAGIEVIATALGGQGRSSMTLGEGAVELKGEVDAQHVLLQSFVVFGRRCGWRKFQRFLRPMRTSLGSREGIREHVVKGIWRQ